MKATLHAQFQKGKNHTKYHKFICIYIHMYINPYILEVTTSIFFSSSIIINKIKKLKVAFFLLLLLITSASSSSSF